MALNQEKNNTVLTVSEKEQEILSQGFEFVSVNEHQNFAYSRYPDATDCTIRSYKKGEEKKYIISYLNSEGKEIVINQSPSNINHYIREEEKKALLKTIYDEYHLDNYKLRLLFGPNYNPYQVNNSLEEYKNNIVKYLINPDNEKGICTLSYHGTGEQYQLLNSIIPGINKFVEENKDAYYSNENLNKDEAREKYFSDCKELLKAFKSIGHNAVVESCKQDIVFNYEIDQIFEYPNKQDLLKGSFNKIMEFVSPYEENIKKELAKGKKANQNFIDKNYRNIYHDVGDYLSAYDEKSPYFEINKAVYEAVKNGNNLNYWNLRHNLQDLSNSVKEYAFEIGYETEKVKKLTNSLVKNYLGLPNPVYSYDEKTHKRIEDTKTLSNKRCRDNIVGLFDLKRFGLSEEEFKNMSHKQKEAVQLANKKILISGLYGGRSFEDIFSSMNTTCTQEMIEELSAHKAKSAHKKLEHFVKDELDQIETSIKLKNGEGMFQECYTNFLDLCKAKDIKSNVADKVIENRLSKLDKEEGRIPGTSYNTYLEYKKNYVRPEFDQSKEESRFK